MIENDRPVVVAVHKKLEFELKERKRELEAVTGRPVKGGLTTYSEFAAFELETIRKSGDQINAEILKIKSPDVHDIVIDSINRKMVPYEHFKKLFIFTSILNKKKDQKQINVDITKLKGLKKNNVRIFY